MIEELDKNGVDAEAMDMLKLRLQMAKSSVKKYQAAERCVCSDGRARGLFQFYGASRTVGIPVGISSYRICRRAIFPRWMRRGNW